MAGYNGIITMAQKPELFAALKVQLEIFVGQPYRAISTTVRSVIPSGFDFQGGNTLVETRYSVTVSFITNYDEFYAASGAEIPESMISVSDVFLQDNIRDWESISGVREGIYAAMKQIPLTTGMTDGQRYTITFNDRQQGRR